MKLKQSPDDFQVEELTDVVPGDRGPFAFYRLEKHNWTTPDALALLRRRWKIEPRRLSYGGLKDRHAATIQYLSVFRGPQRNLSQQGVTITYLGQIESPYTSHDIRANRFVIILRQAASDEAGRILSAVEEVRRDGLPNYFDDQRFGSVSEDGEFIGRLLVQGRFEDALRLALTGPYEFDSAGQKREKEILRAHWGDWPACKPKLERGHARSLVDYLVHHPSDFRGTIERLRPELRGLYLSAYQSELWNRTLALNLRRLAPNSLILVDQKRGVLPFPHGLDEAQRSSLAALSLPLASARLKLAPDDPRGELIRAVLAEEGLTLEQMKVRGSRELFFSRGERPALCQPRELTAVTEDDERHKGQRKVRLAFELPRGSYATLLVKRVTSMCNQPDAQARE
jgi:tRNA pseudouridine13 synthase